MQALLGIRMKHIVRKQQDQLSLTRLALVSMRRITHFSVRPSLPDQRFARRSGEHALVAQDFGPEIVSVGSVNEVQSADVAL
jgi:hypothetical protein